MEIGNIDKQTFIDLVNQYKVKDLHAIANHFNDLQYTGLQRFLCFCMKNKNKRIRRYFVEQTYLTMVKIRSGENEQDEEDALKNQMKSIGLEGYETFSNILQLITLFSNVPLLWQTY